MTDPAPARPCCLAGAPRCCAISTPERSAAGRTPRSTGRRPRSGAAATTAALLVGILASAAASSPAAASASASGPAAGSSPVSFDGLRAWWQFDEGDWSADELGAVSLSPGIQATAFFADPPIAVERALRVAPGVTSAVTVPFSTPRTHWTLPGPDGLSILVVLRVDGLGGAADATGLGGRWEDDGEGQWRLDLDPDGALRLTVGTTAGVVPVSVPGTSVGDVLTVVATLPPNGAAGGTVTLDVFTAAGPALGSASAILPADLQAGTNRLEWGRTHLDNDRSAVAAIDLAAIWTRTLDPAERSALAPDPGAAPLRWATANGVTGLLPPGRRMDRIAGVLDGGPEADIRHVVIGDSFASTLGWNRVFPAILKVNPWPAWSGLVTGVRPTHAMMRATSALTDAAGSNPRTIGAVEAYAVEWAGGTDPGDFYGLPAAAASELRAHSGLGVPTDGTLWELLESGAAMSDGATGPFSRAGDRVRLRLVHRRTSDDVLPLESIRLVTDTPSPGGPAAHDVDLLAGPPRQAASDFGFIETLVAADGALAARVTEVAPGDVSQGPERFAGLVSIVAWKVDAKGERLPGPSYATLNDGSWSLSDLSADAEADGTGNFKQYSGAQLASWLDMTTVDASRPLVFWWYVDAEVIPRATVASRSRTMIDVADAACAAAGLDRPRHCLVVPHTHQRGASDTTDGMAIVFEAWRGGFHDVVDDPAYDHVAAFSIRDATGGRWFDGRDSSVAWLAAEGYDDFAYGVYTGETAIDLTAKPSLLDEFDVHPVDQDAAAFFASILAAGVPPADGGPDPCPGDVDGDGLVGFSDLVEVLAGWGPCPGGSLPCPADRDGDGDGDFDDLLVVLTSWGGCPA